MLNFDEARFIRIQSGAVAAANDLRGIVGEALANAIEHSGTGGSIDVRCQISEGKIVATIVDAGRGFNSADQPMSPPPLFAERGRGLPLPARLTSRNRRPRSRATERPRDPIGTDDARH